MPFSKGQKIFALIFIISFVIMLIMAYRKDLGLLKVYYKGAWKIVLGIAIILGILVYLVKKTH